MRYALKKMRRVIVNDIATGKHKFTMVEIKTSTCTMGQDTVWCEGANGVRLAGFDEKKTSTFKFESGIVSTGVIEAQTGGTKTTVSSGTKIKIREEFTLTTGALTSVTLAYTPAGTTGNEIVWIYKEDSTGEPSIAYPQAATASTTAFSYATKVVTLPTTGFAAGDVVCVDYFPTFSTYDEIKNNSDSFSVNGEVFIDAWFTDLCSKADVPVQLHAPTGKVSGAFDLAFGDAVATQTVEIEALPSVCAGVEKNLWTMRIYDLKNAT